MSMNMDGVLVVTRSVWRHMQASGCGSIVNQSSTAAYLYSGFHGLAKAGVTRLTQQLADEIAGAVHADKHVIATSRTSWAARRRSTEASRSSSSAPRCTAWRAGRARPERVDDALA
jgi:NAD(P)-dependent dehydrogenase (short-subunit alcohol dehydrogenase family)